jgi:choice-of-anchor A domain-containing protein
MRSWVSVCRFVLPAVLTVGVGRAQTLIDDLDNFATDTSQYNLMAFGNVSLEGSSDTQGGIAVGGSLTIGGSWTIASQSAPGSDPSLYLAGSSLSLSGTSDVDNGYAAMHALSSRSWKWKSSQNELYSSSNSGNSLTMNSGGGDPINNTESPANWSSLQSDFETISTSLGSATANGTISVSGQNLVFSPPSGMTSGIAVFTLDASQLSSGEYDGQRISNIQINVPSGIDYVINVINLANNQTLFGSGINFNSGTNDDQLLWNFEGNACGNGTTFTISDGGNFYGSILAPDATLTDSTTVDGQVVADNFTDTGVELHDTGFSPVQVLVPEAGTYAWWALGLCGAAVVLVRRRTARGAGASVG